MAGDRTKPLDSVELVPTNALVSHEWSSSRLVGTQEVIWLLPVARHRQQC